MYLIMNLLAAAIILALSCLLLLKSQYSMAAFQTVKNRRK